MCRADGGDSATVYSERFVCARKSHACAECGRAISPGERYRYAFAVFDGCAESHHTCLHCMAGTRWLARECGGWIFGEVAAELREHAQEYPHFAVPLLRLAVGARRKWRTFGGDSLMPVPAIPDASVHHWITEA